LVKLPVSLGPEHVGKDARVLHDRSAILPLLKPGGVFVEIGVAFGDFSAAVLPIYRPRKFVAIDLFNLHELKTLWGRPPAATFGTLSHEQFFRKRFTAEIAAGVMEVRAGDSAGILGAMPDHSVDVAYIDAGHLYEDVRADLAQADRIVKPDGVIILNDYIMFDHLTKSEYGVVQAANEFIVERGWQVIFFTFQQQMFCDLAIARRTAG
jgi:hypothetical protein